ncbi:MAG TPA: DUF2239 family protein [Dyella sp.]|uniref:DUF2239 family protein n=1 Tax=Dyella sp. TaxID=1869338 RepID=UPI002F93CB07
MTCTAFAGTRRLASGALADVALAVKRVIDAQAEMPVLIFDDSNARQIELDLRGSEQDVLARLQVTEPSPARGPGRPRLGVTAREVTLLPRHWDWLAEQPGGASAVLRRLVEAAIRRGDAEGRASQANEAADRFMRVMAGDYPGYEEASRAFWRGEAERFDALTAPWPADVRDHLRKLAAIAWDERRAS